MGDHSPETTEAWAAVGYRYDVTELDAMGRRLGAYRGEAEPAEWLPEPVADPHPQLLAEAVARRWAPRHRGTTAWRVVVGGDGEWGDICVDATSREPVAMPRSIGAVGALMRPHAQSLRAVTAALAADSDPPREARIAMVAAEIVVAAAALLAAGPCAGAPRDGARSTDLRRLADELTALTRP